MLRPEDVYSLTDFKRRTHDHLRALSRSGRARLLTINGRAKVVIQDAAAYQKFLEKAEHAEAIVGIQRGLDDVRAGRVMPLREAIESIRKTIKPRRRK